MLMLWDQGSGGIWETVCVYSTFCLSLRSVILGLFTFCLQQNHLGCSRRACHQARLLVVKCMTVIFIGAKTNSLWSHTSLALTPCVARWVEMLWAGKKKKCVIQKQLLTSWLKAFLLASSLVAGSDDWRTRPGRPRLDLTSGPFSFRCWIQTLQSEPAG